MTSHRPTRASVELDARVRRRGRPGPATEADVPKPRPLPGRRIPVLEGQLDLSEREHRGAPLTLRPAACEDSDEPHPVNEGSDEQAACPDDPIPFYKRD
jgi:hypothetical protein